MKLVDNNKEKTEMTSNRIWFKPRTKNIYINM